MSRLIDADKLEPDTEWNDYYDDFVSYSQSQIRNAEEVQSIPLDKVKQVREEIKKLYIEKPEKFWEIGRNAMNMQVLEILDKLIESEE